MESLLHICSLIVPQAPVPHGGYSHRYNISNILIRKVDLVAPFIADSSKCRKKERKKEKKIYGIFKSEYVTIHHKMYFTKKYGQNKTATHP